MEKISTSLLVLLGVQQIVHLLSLMQENPILDTSGLEHVPSLNFCNASLTVLTSTYVHM